MGYCEECGGKLRRIHRTPIQRIAYEAVYECRDCGEQECIRRPVMNYFGRYARCPRCGTMELRRLRAPDRIDRFYTHPFSLLARMLTDRLYHCALCRIQFHDFRRSQRRDKDGAPEVNTAKQDA